jgi:hypothetical protein
MIGTASTAPLDVPQAVTRLNQVANRTPGNQSKTPTSAMMGIRDESERMYGND